MPKLRHDSAQIVMVVLLTLFALWSLVPCSRADEDRWWGTIMEMIADEDAYTVQTEDGRLFKLEWCAGYSGWDVGDTVILTVDSGFGFMVYGTYHTRVWVDEVTDLVPDNQAGGQASVRVDAVVAPTNGTQPLSVRCGACELGPIVVNVIDQCTRRMERTRCPFVTEYINWDTLR